VAAEVERFRTASRQRGAAPVIAALRARLESLRVAELERRRAQLADLSEEEWDQVDQTTRATLAKMLHEPTILLKETAGTPRGERLVEALRILFDL
jgi:glutamyl-tRNA reductase